MKITEITPPIERKFTLELSEDEMYQLMAVCGKFNGRHGHCLADLHFYINEALGDPIACRWNVRVFEHKAPDINLSLVPFGGQA